MQNGAQARRCCAIRANWPAAFCSDSLGTLAIGVEDQTCIGHMLQSERTSCSSAAVLDVAATGSQIQVLGKKTDLTLK